MRPTAADEPDAVTIALALWAWLAASVLVALAAWAAGAEIAPLGEALALAIAPALGGFVLLPVLGGWVGAAALMLVWALAVMGLVAGSGGALSPLVAAFAIVPAWTGVLRRGWAAEAGAVSVLGYAAASGLSLLDTEPAAPLGAFPEAMAVVSLGFAAALLAVAHRRGRRGSMAYELAGVSHDLRTPLTHILGFSEMIERRMFGDLGERYVEYAGLIRQSGAHLLEVVNDVLDLSKIGAGKFELDLAEFDARDVADEVVRMAVDSATRKSIVLGLTTPGAPLRVRGDVVALRRILINTLGNAVKFTPQGGRVLLAARAEGGSAIFETSDTGPGFSRRERGELGGAFSRGAHAAGAEGAGLGLALVRALAELHGGALELRDAPGGGALVRVSLPILAESN